MNAAVAHHHLWRAEGVHSVHGLLQCRRGHVRIDARQRRQQAVAQDHLTVIGTFRVDALGGDVRPVHKLPASFLKPAYAVLFELLFVQHDPNSCAPLADQWLIRFAMK